MSFCPFFKHRTWTDKICILLEVGYRWMILGWSLEILGAKFSFVRLYVSYSKMTQKQFLTRNKKTIGAKVHDARNFLIQHVIWHTKIFIKKKVTEILTWNFHTMFRMCIHRCCPIFRQYWQYLWKLSPFMCWNVSHFHE